MFFADGILIRQNTGAYRSAVCSVFIFSYCLYGDAVLK